MAGTKIQDVSTTVSKKHGNGILRREVWVHGEGKVVAAEFVTFEAIEDRFQTEWMVFKRKGKK